MYAISEKVSNQINSIENKHLIYFNLYFAEKFLPRHIPMAHQQFPTYRTTI